MMTKEQVQAIALVTPREDSKLLASTCLALYEREERLLAAAQGLVDKLAAIEDDPRYKSVWTINQLHVGPYSGPTYVNELDTLRAALKETAP